LNNKKAKNERSRLRLAASPLTPSTRGGIGSHGRAATKILIKTVLTAVKVIPFHGTISKTL
jgi:hypothetical protein